ncbi:MAG: corrinoid protein-associated methyltransferase CpaM [Candidatus Bathyarchaeia archaeon]
MCKFAFFPKLLAACKHMCSYVLMKLLESSERRYDTGINLLTFGNARRVKDEIASRFISKNDRVLEIGVGTGTLAILCAKRGAYVTGIDVSRKMLEIAKRKVVEARLTGNIELKNMSVVEIDEHVPDCYFDKVLGTLVLSEMSEDEQRFALKEFFRVLKPDGKIIIADEVKPRSLGKRILYYLIRIPLVAITYLFAQTTTRPLKNIEQKIFDARFRVEYTSRYFLDSLELIVASKEER